MASSKQVVAIKSERIAACMTCPICHKLFKNATTISECLHTFCRKCIHDLITKEDLDCCPVCNVYLGCSPLEKLRADHSLQDIRAAIFGALGRRERKKAEAGPSNPLPATIEPKELPEAEPSVPLPSRRKERSLSSLVSPPKASSQTVFNGRRKSEPRRFPVSRGSALSIEKSVTREENCPKSSSPHLTLSKIAQIKKQNLFPGESSNQEPIKREDNRPKSSSPHPNLGKIAHSKKQNLFSGESSNQNVPHKAAEVHSEPLEAMTDLWKPLNCLVEAAGITKSSKSTMQVPMTKSTPTGIYKDEASLNYKTKLKERVNKQKLHDDGVGSNPMPSVSINPKTQGDQQKRTIDLESSNAAPQPQPVVNAATGRVRPIWLSLIASDSQEGNAPLPQIPSYYLMLKNPDLPVSSIQKYIVQKLDLDNEAEVEITLQGQPLLPTLQLGKLVDLWLKGAPKSERIDATAGNSAENCVMVLRYSRKAQPF
ncbi:E3 ubiquitin protein ligase DRIP2-like [Actinidia eriantha]|uniref:E3 ubiquitin protein ligase DRIP2-like n=1 Tax=Actinidia eriantha TaxID=165200 RepID=UPI002588A1DA|nr:E3 ubiquitin protein ligase DRIP2-like [Actinidia eriantha]